MNRSIKRDDDHKQEMAGTLEKSLVLMKEALEYARRNPSMMRKKERDGREMKKWKREREIEERGKCRLRMRGELYSLVVGCEMTKMPLLKWKLMKELEGQFWNFIKGCTILQGTPF